MRYLIIILALPFLTACGPAPIYEKDVAFPESGWAYADSVRFDYTITDSDKTYDLVLDVAHNDDFAYQNFYVKLHTTPPSGKRSSSQLSLQLAGNFGEWLGNCSGGKCRLSIPFLKEVNYLSPGDYSLTVEQYSRDEPLPALTGLGLRIIVHEE